jgi:hypothetical protein
MPHDTNPAAIPGFRAGACERRIRSICDTAKVRPEALPEDCHDEAVKFLAGVFSVSDDVPFLDRALRHWKFYAPHPFAAPPRCYVFRDGQQALVAHAGVSPVEYDTPGGVRTSFQMIDWGGSPRRPGAGFLLFRALWSTADSYLCVGGSDDARKVMGCIPTVRPIAGMEIFAYPLRPWGQFSASALSWKAPLKLARSWRWRQARRRPSLSQWKAVPLRQLNQADAPLLVPASGGLYTPLRRTPELVNYWLACPAGRLRAWRLEHAGAAAGILVLAFLPREVRIVDLIVTTPSAPLAEAFSLAIDLAAEDSDVFELSAGSSALPVIQAMTEAGMIPRGVAGVLLGDPQKRFPAQLPLEVNLTNGDGFFQRGKQPYFHTF